jgi:hypothetical protein
MMWESILGETLGGEPVSQMMETMMHHGPPPVNSLADGGATVAVRLLHFRLHALPLLQSKPIGSRRIDTKFRLHDATPNRIAQ